MKLFEISRDVTYYASATISSAIVVAESAEKARYIHPNGINIEWNEHDGKWYEWNRPNYNWTRPKNVTVREIGETSIDMKPDVLYVNLQE